MGGNVLSGSVSGKALRRSGRKDAGKGYCVSRYFQIGGWLLDTRLSRCMIPGFVKRHGLSPAQWEKQTFTSYNDFFTRKLKKGQRSFSPEKEVFGSPVMEN